MMGFLVGTGMHALDDQLSALGCVPKERIWQTTPHGEPSGEITSYQFQAQEFVVLPRHGAGHGIAAHSIPYAANIAALLKLGCTQVLSIATGGSLNKEIRPGDVTLIRDLCVFDRWSIDKSIPQGCVIQPGPVTERREAIDQLALRINGRQARYAQISGPFPASREQITLMCSAKCDVVGMTLANEIYSILSFGRGASGFLIITDSCIEGANSAWEQVSSIGAKLIVDVLASKELLPFLVSTLRNLSYEASTITELSGYFELKNH